MIVYGIPNCDTIKKTLDFLRKHKYSFEFHDYKKSGITKTKLNEWCTKVGWELILNKKSATWRGLSLAEQQQVTDKAAAIKLMMENNSIIKRPIIETGQKLLVGYNETDFIKQLK